MYFSEAFKLMESGLKVKLPSWGGYWYWSKENNYHAYKIWYRNGYPRDTGTGVYV